jgi:hypothetical protein
MPNKFILKVIFIILLSFISTKAFSYELITGIGYGQSNHTGTSSQTITASVDAYVPLWFDGFNVGIGTSYFGANLGSSSTLASNFPIYSSIEEKDIKIPLLPVYLGAKYEYFFNKKFSAFISGRYGISVGKNQYYTGKKDYYDEETEQEEITRDSLEIYGNMMYGASIGISFLNNYMISINYDNMAVKNIYHINKSLIEDRYNITNVETVSLKLSYAFRK